MNKILHPVFYLQDKKLNSVLDYSIECSENFKIKVTLITSDEVINVLKSCYKPVISVYFLTCEADVIAKEKLFMSLEADSYIIKKGSVLDLIKKDYFTPIDVEFIASICTTYNN